MFEGVCADSAGASANTDCVSHIPKQPSDTLEDWQRIAEFYVERPRIIMCGRAVRNICYNSLVMTLIKETRLICTNCLGKTQPLSI